MSTPTPAPPRAPRTTGPTRPVVSKNDASDTHSTAVTAAENSSIRVPVGNAKSVVASLHGNPKALHDVEFYNAVLDEIPDCPVVHSILYTHRSSLEDAETPDEMLKELDEKIAKWRAQRLEEVASEQESVNASQKEECRAANSENEKLDAQREALMSALAVKIQTIEGQVKADVAKISDQHNAQRAALEQAVQDGTYEAGAPPPESPFYTEWQDVQRRAQERDRAAREAVARIEEQAKLKAERRAEMELITTTAKIGINEQLTRGLVYSEEDADRLHLRRLYVLSKERVSALEDAVEYKTETVMAAEGRIREQLVQQMQQEYELLLNPPGEPTVEDTQNIEVEKQGQSDELEKANERGGQ